MWAWPNGRPCQAPAATCTACRMTRGTRPPESSNRPTASLPTWPAGGLDTPAGHVGKLAVGRLLDSGGRVPRVIRQAVQVAAGAWHGLPFGQAHMHQIPHRVGDGSRADLQSSRQILSL